MPEEAAASHKELLEAVGETRRRISRALPVIRRHELSLEEFLVLAALAEAPEGLSMGHLARQTGASSPTLSRHVDALVSRALLFREISAADRRVSLMFVSKRGRELLRNVDADLAALGSAPALEFG